MRPRLRRIPRTRTSAIRSGTSVISRSSRTASYELATSNYLAGGGSGFLVLKQNTTQNNTGVQQRDALIDYIRAGAPCGTDPKTGAPPPSCSIDADCANNPNFAGTAVCACPGAVMQDPNTGPLHHQQRDRLRGQGQCVLQQCRDDVAAVQGADLQRRPHGDDRGAVLGEPRPLRERR